MTTIKLDIDTPKYSLHRLSARLRWIMRIYRIPTVEVHAYRTKNGWHLYLYPDKNLVPEDTVLIQTLLGSDPNRELFNLERIKDATRRYTNWNVLFNVKMQGKRVISREILKTRWLEIITLPAKHHSIFILSKKRTQ